MQRRIEGGEEPRVRSVVGLLVEVHLVGPRRAHCARHHPHPRQARDPHSMTHNSAPALSPHRRNRRSERHERHRPLHGQGSPSAPAAASAAPGLMAAGVASSDNEEWSLYGAPWLQPVATSGKWRGREDRSNRRKPLLWVATDCLSHGKEGVSGSSPEEGFEKVLHSGFFRRATVCVCSTTIGRGALSGAPRIFVSQICRLGWQRPRRS